MSGRPRTNSLDHPIETRRRRIDVPGRVGSPHLEIVVTNRKAAICLWTRTGSKSSTVEAALESAASLCRAKRKRRAFARGWVRRFPYDVRFGWNRVDCPDELGRRAIYVAGCVDRAHLKRVFPATQAVVHLRAGAGRKRTRVQLTLKRAPPLGRSEFEACTSIVCNCRRVRNNGGIRTCYINKPGKARRSGIGLAGSGRAHPEGMVSGAQSRIRLGAHARGERSTVKTTLKRGPRRS